MLVDLCCGVSACVCEVVSLLCGCGRRVLRVLFCAPCEPELLRCELLKYTNGGINPWQGQAGALLGRLLTWAAPNLLVPLNLRMHAPDCGLQIHATQLILGSCKTATAWRQH